MFFFTDSLNPSHQLSQSTVNISRRRTTWAFNYNSNLTSSIFLNQFIIQFWPGLESTTSLLVNIDSTIEVPCDLILYEYFKL